MTPVMSREARRRNSGSEASGEGLMVAEASRASIAWSMTWARAAVGIGWAGAAGRLMSDGAILALARLGSSLRASAAFLAANFCLRAFFLSALVGSSAAPAGT